LANLFFLSGQCYTDETYTAALMNGAKLYTYETGTTTNKATYSNAALSSANANPVVADSDGVFGDIYMLAGRYKMVLKTSADVTVQTWDPVDATSQLFTAASAPSPTYPFLRYHNSVDGHVYRRNAADNAWIDEGAVDSLLNAATVTETLTGTDSSKATTPDSVAALWQRGTNISPSGGTVSLPSTGGGVFNIAAGNFSAISTAQGGRAVLFIFGGTSVITHNATSMILPGGGDITSEAGDCACFVNEAAADANGTNWRCVWYQRDAATLVSVPDYAASQAEQETGSSVIKNVTSGRQQYHRSAIKAWLNYDHAGAAISESYGVTSVDDDGTGLFGINFSVTFGNTTYTAAGFARSTATTTMLCLSASSTVVKTTTAMDFFVRRGTDALADSAEVGVMVAGDLA